MRILIFIFFTSFALFATNSEIQASYSVGVFHENGSGENVQHKKITDQDYNGVCFSKIVVFGEIRNKKIEVKIGKSLGYFESSIPIYNNQKIYIAEELTFKHYNVSKCYLEVKINDKIYDTKVFVK
jgi:hypothetical protein